MTRPLLALCAAALATAVPAGATRAGELGFPGIIISAAADGRALVRTDEPPQLRLVSASGAAVVAMPGWQATAAALLDPAGAAIFLAGIDAMQCRLAVARLDPAGSGPPAVLPDPACVERLYALPGGGAAGIDRAGDAILFDAAGARTAHCRFAAPRGAHGGGIGELAISPDGAWIAALDRTGAIRGPGGRDRLLLCRAASGAVAESTGVAADRATGLAWLSPAELAVFHPAGGATLVDAARGAALRKVRAPALATDRWTRLPSGRLAGTSASGAVVVDYDGAAFALAASQREPGWRYTSVAGAVVRARLASPARLELEWLDAALAGVTHRRAVSVPARGR